MRCSGAHFFLHGGILAPRIILFGSRRYDRTIDIREWDMVLPGVVGEMAVRVLKELHHGLRVPDLVVLGRVLVRRVTLHEGLSGSHLVNGDHHWGQGTGDATSVKPSNVDHNLQAPLGEG